MLDPASIEKLAASPEQNDPMLNVALAEEGGAAALLALAGFEGLGPEAIDVIAARIEREGEALAITAGEDEARSSVVVDLEQKLIGHRNAPRAVRDAVLRRHVDDPFYVLSAAAHADASPFALETAAQWPAASPLHDRPWLVLLAAGGCAAALLARWAEGAALLREAAALVAADGALLDRLARDPSRSVRRALASNVRAGEIRARMAMEDSAVEVRARAAAPLPTTEADVRARFSAALRAMREGGVLAMDVRRALLGAGASLDEEGAFLGARYLDRDELHSLVAQTTGTDQDACSARGTGVGVGLGLRRAARAEAGEMDDVQLTSDLVHLVTRQPSAETRLTGKARVALWIADCLARSRIASGEELARTITPGTLASDRMVLLRWAAHPGARAACLCSGESGAAVPPAVVELSWRDSSISDEAVVALSTRVAPSARLDRELPEDELDLAPLARPLAVLERGVLAAIARVPLSPRAALAAIALEPRRCRYVLSAMPTWKGALTGARLARVLRAYAGALSAAARPQAGATASGSTAPRAASVARWTERRLIEVEAAIAIAIGDLTGNELVRRLLAGSIQLQDGVALAAGIEARAAIEGPAAFAQVLDYAAARRTQNPAALALWMLLENLDRVRAASLIASAIDGLSVSGSVVAPAVCEALSTLERRSPGRLENVHAQSPRGRATVASAIARAYRAFGGMRDEG